MQGGVAIVLLLLLLVFGILWYTRQVKKYTHADAVVYTTVALIEVKQKRQVLEGKIVPMPTLYNVSDLQKWLTRVYWHINFYTPAWSRALSVFMQICKIRKPVPQQLGDILLIAEYLSSITPEASEETIRKVYYEALYGD
jgi:hypothetical protein